MYSVWPLARLISLLGFISLWVKIFSVHYFLAVILEIYFETYWTKADNIFLMPNEQAAIVTFSDHKGTTVSD